MGELVKVTFTRRFPALALSGNLPLRFLSWKGGRVLLPQPWDLAVSPWKCSALSQEGQAAMSARVRNGYLLGLPSPEFLTVPASHQGDVQMSLQCNPATGKASIFFLLIERKPRALCILSPLLTELHPAPLSIPVTKYLSSSRLGVIEKFVWLILRGWKPK